MSLIDRFHRHLMTDCALTDKTTVLLAVSGGLDSMVMASLFRAIDWPFAIAHCNFQLRGAASHDDARFVQNWADQAGVRIFIEQFDTKQYADSEGVSTQMAARTLRYAWFETLCLDNDFAAVATAHHLNDAVETVLLNFVRGTGLKGLLGIPARAEHRLRVPVVRPLVAFTRAELEAFAQQHHMNWQEDTSNAHDDYDRNYLRHHLMPLLRKLNPGIEQTAGRNIQKLTETDENYDFLWKNHLGIDDRGGAIVIEKKRIIAMPFPGRLLRELLRPYRFDEEQCRQIADHLDEPGFELTSESGWRALVERNHFRVVSVLEISQQDEAVRIDEDDLMVRLPDGSRIMMMPVAPETVFPDGRHAILADASALQFPLSLRRWQSGDMFQPFGMSGNSQTLQDYFTNQKLSRLEKESIWLLCNGDGTIIWVIGHRMSERVRVYPDTQRCMRFQFGE